MPIYLYKARDEEGRLIKGKMDAADEENLLQKLQGIGFLVTQFSLEKKDFLKADIFNRRSITFKDKYTLTLQLANTIDAGVPIMSALDSIIAECRNVTLRKVLEQMRSDINSGISLAEAFKKHPRVFSNFYSSMVELGEGSGNLTKVLFEMAGYIKRDIEVRRKIVSTVTYPVILVFAAVGVAAFLLVSVIPKFIVVFKEAGAALPLPTIILIALSNFVSRYWHISLFLGFVSIFAFQAIAKTKYGRLKIDQIKLRIPLFGNLFRKLCIYRFTEALCLLYNSGLPIIRALKIIEDVVQNEEMANVVKTLSAHLTKGEDLVTYLRMVDFFPADVIAMIKVGEEGGKLGDVLNKVSEFYQDEINYTIERLVSLLEPTIILFMGIGVAFLAMAVMFPIFKLSSLATAR